MRKNPLRTILKGLSLTSAMFIFQACYGSPNDMGRDLLVEGQVKSASSGLPVKGIKVSIAESGLQYELTDNDGKFSFYSMMLENLKIRFEDIDSSQNGSYQTKDTILTNFGTKVILDINLDEK